MMLVGRALAALSFTMIAPTLLSREPELDSVQVNGPLGRRVDAFETRSDGIYLERPRRSEVPRFIISRLIPRDSSSLGHDSPMNVIAMRL
jgi:hypothetical protein